MLETLLRVVPALRFQVANYDEYYSWLIKHEGQL